MRKWSIYLPIIYLFNLLPIPEYGLIWSSAISPAITGRESNMKTITLPVTVTITDVNAVVDYKGNKYLDKLNNNMKFSIEEKAANCLAEHGYVISVNQRGGISFKYAPAPLVAPVPPVPVPPSSTGPDWTAIAAEHSLDAAWLKYLQDCLKAYNTPKEFNAALKGAMPSAKGFTPKAWAELR